MAGGRRLPRPLGPLWQPEGDRFDVCGAPVVPGDPSQGCYPPVAYPPLDAIHRYLWLSQGVIPPGDRCLLATTAFAAGDTLGAFPTASAGLRTPDGGHLQCDETTDATAPPPPVTGALGPDPNQGFNVHLESTSSTRITYAAGAATDFTDDYTETHPLDDGGVHYGHLAPPPFAPANFYGSYDADRCPYYDLGYGAAYVLRDHLAAATAQADPAEPMLCNPHWMAGVKLYSLPHFMVHRYRSEIDRTSDSPGRLLSCPPPWVEATGPNGIPPCGHTMNLLDAEHRDAGVVSYNPGTPADRFSLPVPGDPTSSSWWVPLTDPDPSGSDLDDLASDEQEPAFEQHIAVGAVGLFNEHDITRGVGQITTVWKRLLGDDSAPEFIVTAIRVDYIKYSNGGREPFLVPSMTSGSLTADIVHTQYELNRDNVTLEDARNNHRIDGVEWKTSPSMALPSHQKRCYWAWFNGTEDQPGRLDTLGRAGMWGGIRGRRAAGATDSTTGGPGWWWFGRTNQDVGRAQYQIDSLQSRAGFAYDYSLFHAPDDMNRSLALVFLPARQNVVPRGTGALARIFPLEIPYDAPVETAEDPRLAVGTAPEFQLMAGWQANQQALAGEFPCFDAPDPYGEPADDHTSGLATLDPGALRPRTTP